MLRKSLFTLIAFSFVLGTFSSTGHLTAQEATPSAIELALPPDAEVGGASLAEWTARYWQWTYSFPPEVNPGADETGEQCGYGQSGPVFFLASADHSVERSCTVPTDVHLYVPLGQAECSTVEPPPFYGGTEEELRACAISAVDSAESALDMTAMTLTVDGQEVTNLLDYRTLTPLFTIWLPENNALGSDSQTTESIGDGYQVILAPLSPGEHVITITLPYPIPDLTTITYRLTVVSNLAIALEATPASSTSGIVESTVDVAGRTLHLACAGTGGPTILLEQGGPNTVGGSQVVADAGPDILGALGVRFCSYDRAGSGLSDSDPNGLHTFRESSADLLAVMASPELECPCVVVGESMGGGIALVALTADATNFAGLVLLDSLYPGSIDEFLNLIPDGAPESLPGFQNYMTGENEEQLDLLASFRQITVPSEPMSIPITVVTHGTGNPPPCFPCSEGFPIADYEEAWQAGQIALAKALGGKLVVAENTSHFIADENVGLVITVVTEVITAVLDPTSWATASPSS